MDYLVQEKQLTVKQAFSCVAMSRATYYRKPMGKAIKDAPVIDALNTIIAKHGRLGLWTVFRPTQEPGIPLEPQESLAGIQGHEAQYAQMN